MKMLASQSSTETNDEKERILLIFLFCKWTDTHTESCLCTHGNQRPPEQLMFRLLSHWSCLQKYLLTVDNQEKYQEIVPCTIDGV